MSDAAGGYRGWSFVAALVVFVVLAHGSSVEAADLRRHGGSSSLDVTSIDAGVSAPLDLNTGSIDELAGIPGIGEQRARAIVEYRDRNGPFQAVEDLLDVDGIGALELSGFLDRVSVPE